MYLSLSLSLPTENLAISFPEEDEIPEDAQDLVHQLMCFDPMYRLGSTAREGVAGVKSHPFFNNIDWTLLLRTKAEFIPQLRGEDDTSYFDGEKLEFFLILPVHIHVLQRMYVHGLWNFGISPTNISDCIYSNF